MSTRKRRAQFEWTPLKLRRLKAMARDGYEITAMMESFGASWEVVSAKMTALGLYHGWSKAAIRSGGLKREAQREVG